MLRQQIIVGLSFAGVAWLAFKCWKEKRTWLKQERERQALRNLRPIKFKNARRADAQ